MTEAASPLPRVSSAESNQLEGQAVVGRTGLRVEHGETPRAASAGRSEGAYSYMARLPGFEPKPVTCWRVPAAARAVRRENLRQMER
ncbi:hypothetical protein ABZ646_19460 [Streptomyces sp. NPDC007162]|uniref:hypothetical protein n=1 Tax=Streptomyces sp. NPDC007162 TaxID=3156917 RepID=UPI0033FA8E8B